MSALRELYQQVILAHNKSPRNFRAMRQALWPPKPKELLITALIFIGRAVLGT